MKPEEMKVISEHLVAALEREGLSTRDAAKFLNMNPAYVSMAKNPKMWDSMSKDAWYRLTQWHNNRGRISEFKIPEDEPVWEPTPKTSMDATGTANLTREEKRKNAAARKKTETLPPPAPRPAEHPFPVEKADPAPGIEFTDTARLKVALDIEINLVINGQKISLR